MITPTTTVHDVSDSNRDDEHNGRKKNFHMKCDSGYLTKQHLIHRMMQKKQKRKPKTKHKNENEREKTTSNEMKKNGCHLLTLI